MQRSILLPIQQAYYRKIPYSSMYQYMIYKKNDVLPVIYKPDYRDYIAKLVSHSGNVQKRLRLERNAIVASRSRSEQRPSSAFALEDISVDREFHVRYQLLYCKLQRSNQLITYLQKINRISLGACEY